MGGQDWNDPLGDLRAYAHDLRVAAPELDPDKLRPAGDRFTRGTTYASSTPHLVVAVVVMFLLIAGGAGTAFAANRAVPGDPLYSIDLLLEDAWMAIGLPLDTTAERLAEARVLAERHFDLDAAPVPHAHLHSIDPDSVGDDIIDRLDTLDFALQIGSPANPKLVLPQPTDASAPTMPPAALSLEAEDPGPSLAFGLMEEAEARLDQIAASELPIPGAEPETPAAAAGNGQSSTASTQTADPDSAVTTPAADPSVATPGPADATPDPDVTTDPTVSSPDPTDPVATDPVATDPVATDPDATDPDVVEPDATVEDTTNSDSDATVEDTTNSDSDTTEGNHPEHPEHPEHPTHPEHPAFPEQAAAGLDNTDSADQTETASN
jgi:hypothetical protein